MLVQDDAETCRLRFADDVVQLREPLGLKAVLCIHMLERLQVDPNEVEAGLVDLGKVAPFEAAFPAIVPIGVIAEHVDTAMEGLVRLREDRRRLRCSDSRSNRQARQRPQSERAQMPQPHSRSPLLAEALRSMIALPSSPASVGAAP